MGLVENFDEKIVLLNQLLDNSESKCEYMALNTLGGMMGFDPTIEVIPDFSFFMSNSAYDIIKKNMPADYINDGYIWGVTYSHVLFDKESTNSMYISLSKHTTSDDPYDFANDNNIIDYGKYAIPGYCSHKTKIYRPSLSVNSRYNYKMSHDGEIDVSGDFSDVEKFVDDKTSGTTFMALAEKLKSMQPTKYDFFKFHEILKEV